jgi:DNA-binding transcriptional LysR family regulator
MINPSRLELRHLRYFAVVAEQLHFGRAAARLAVSQPALSVQIRQLEELAGVRLFERHSRHVALTDAGRVLAEAVARLLRDTEAAMVASRRAAAGQTGELRIGFGPTLMLSTLAEAVRAYRARYPNVRLDLHELPTAEQTSALLGGDLDLGIVRAAAPDPRLRAETFAKEPLLIALDRRHRLARQRQVRVADLATEPWIMFPHHIAPLLHEQVMQLCARAGFRPAVAQESREVYTTVGLVGCGIGVTIVPAAARLMAWKGVVYKTIPKTFVQLSIVRAIGNTRPVVDAFVAAARHAAHHRS